MSKGRQSPPVAQPMPEIVGMAQKLTAIAEELPKGRTERLRKLCDLAHKDLRQLVKTPMDSHWDWIVSRRMRKLRDGTEVTRTKDASGMRILSVKPADQNARPRNFIRTPKPPELNSPTYRLQSDIYAAFQLVWSIVLWLDMKRPSALAGAYLLGPEEKFYRLAPDSADQLHSIAVSVQQAAESRGGPAEPTPRLHEFEHPVKLTDAREIIGGRSDEIGRTLRTARCKYAVVNRHAFGEHDDLCKLFPRYRKHHENL